MLFWIDSAESLITSEVLSTAAFHNFNNYSPKLIWLMITFHPEDPSMVNADAFPDVCSLKERNVIAIDEARATTFPGTVKIVPEIVEIPAAAGQNVTDISILTDDHDKDVGIAGGRAIDEEEFPVLNVSKWPMEVMQEEARTVDFLATLSTPRGTTRFRDILVGGNSVRLQPFHYPATNMEAPKTCKFSQVSYIDEEDMPELFAYDWKNALTLRVMKSSTAGGAREYVPRVYFAYCQLIYMKESEDDVTFEKDQIILIGILSTLCVTARQDFLVLDNKRAEVFLWKNGMQQMRHFYCDRTSAVSKEYLRYKRDNYFGRHYWYYDSKRGIARNHQNPGNYSDDYKKANHVEETAKWKIQVGKNDGRHKTKVPSLGKAAKEDVAASTSSPTIGGAVNNPHKPANPIPKHSTVSFFLCIMYPSLIILIVFLIVIIYCSL